jgi:phosphatidylserine/phosphatidylglycerophosphate/cardiolipin synthase-like enzyme
VDAAFALAKLLPPPRMVSIASRLKTLSPGGDITGIVSLVGSAAAKNALHDFLEAWKHANVPGETVAYILQTAAHTRQETMAEQQIELVLTGPSTPFVSARRTEQVLLDLVRGAKRELFVVSFVTYDWDSVTNAIQEAVARGVHVRVLLEASKQDGGSLARDQSEALRKSVPQASIYHWTSHADKFLAGKVHAKIAVSDEATAFLTSANLTGHAMEKNFEAGVLVRGGEIPGDIARHLQGLIDLQVITKVDGSH